MSSTLVQPLSWTYPYEELNDWIFPRQSRLVIHTYPTSFVKLSIWQNYYWIFSSVFLWTFKKSCPSVFDECCNISRVKIYRYIFNLLYIYIYIFNINFFSLMSSLMSHVLPEFSHTVVPASFLKMFLRHLVFF